MAKYAQPASTVPSVSAEEFFAKYISKRVPVVIKGLLDDPDFKGRNWTDLSYLARKAGTRAVLVEPLHPAARQFGTGAPRVRTTFGAFLKTLQNEDGPHHYLTTQYAEGDADALTALPPPADALADEFPRVPRLMGALCLQQVNLWVGRSAEGSSSGLHHDFHDNLYCLLAGRKRFVLFPPRAAPHLYAHGARAAAHANGLISYAGAPVRPDGLPVRAALKARVRALEARLGALPSGKGKGRADMKARAELVEAHEQALDELAQYTLDAADGVDVDEEEDDFDALMAGLEGGDDFDVLEMDGGGAEGGDAEEEDESEESEEEEYPEWHGIGTAASDEEGSDEESDGAEPASFSRIPTALLHAHLGLPSTAAAPAGASLDAFPALKSAPAPLVAELGAGEMLYLPASWWHEVTSSAAPGGDGVHMAFNYWFYPPDNLGSFERPYEDTLVWEYLRAENPESWRRAPAEPAVETAKRKSNGDGARVKKKSKK